MTSLIDKGTVTIRRWRDETGTIWFFNHLYKGCT